MKIGFLGALQLIFITFKLLGIINWSWWLVLLPILIPLGIFIVLSVVLTALMLFYKDDIEIKKKK